MFRPGCVVPTYCYRDDNTVYEVEFPFGEAPEEIEVRRGDVLVAAQRDLQSELATQSVSVKGGSGHVSRTWPMTCFSSGVSASQADELKTHLKERGVPTEVTADGDPVYTSAAHRRKALKVRGFVDKNSYC